MTNNRMISPVSALSLLINHYSKIIYIVGCGAVAFDNEEGIRICTYLFGKIIE